MRTMFKNTTYLLIILFAFMIGIWLENGSESFYSRNVSPIINFKVPVILVLLLGAWLYQYHLNRVNELEGRIGEYENQVKDGSRALWKYFKDISELKVREIVQDVMKNFTTKHEHVLAVQIYEYSVKHPKKFSMVTVSHKYSFVSEATDINALLQSYYRIPKELYDEYIHVRSNLSQKILLEEHIIVATDFCTKHISNIASKKIEDLTEEDAITYALVEVVLDTLSFLLNEDLSHSLDQGHIIELNSLKRTGILKGIEMRERYTFEYRGVSEKTGRKYLTETLNQPELFNGKPHIILITLNPDYLPVDLEEHQDKLWEIGREFTDLLQKELKTRYNELKDVME